MDPERGTDSSNEALDSSTNIKLQLGNDGTGAGSSVEEGPLIGQNDKTAQYSSGVERTVVDGDEPYVGQEFISEEAAHAFYNAYATCMGFVTRINYGNRSKHDGSIISRAIVCNKEGYKKPYLRDKNIKQRAPTRVGCRAMIAIRKLSSGKWIVTRFEKEHNHVLIASSIPKAFIYNHNPADDKRVQELTQQLLIEKKRTASLKKFIDLLFNHIEEHTHDLSKKIQYIVDSVKELESEGKDRRHCR